MMMTLEEYNIYRKDQNSVTLADGKTKRKIYGMTDIHERPYLILRENSSLRAVPFDLVTLDENKNAAGIGREEDLSPDFSEEEWDNHKPEIHSKLQEYYSETSPKKTKNLRNVSEDPHQGYEGSSQVTQREKKGPPPKEGLNYDKARGRVNKWEQ